MRNYTLLVTMLAGCGASSGGSGSHSLVVRASVDSYNTDNNVTAALQFDSNFRVRVERGTGAGVTGAQVTMTSSMGAVTLREDTNNPDGSYYGDQHGYWQSYTVSVVSGGDRVEGATVAGPSPHTLSEPATANPRPAGGAVDVRWSPTGAMTASVETRQWDSAVDDNGSFTIPSGVIADDNGNGDRVRVVRGNWVPLGGGIGDSRFTVTIRNGIDFPVN